MGRVTQCVPQGARRYVRLRVTATDELSFEPPSHRGYGAAEFRGLEFEVFRRA